MCENGRGLLRREEKELSVREQEGITEGRKQVQEDAVGKAEGAPREWN